MNRVEETSLQCRIVCRVAMDHFLRATANRIPLNPIVSMERINHLKYPVINLCAVDGNDQLSDIPCNQPFLLLISVMNFFISFMNDTVKVFDFYVPLDERICVLK